MSELDDEEGYSDAPSNFEGDAFYDEELDEEDDEDLLETEEIPLEEIEVDDSDSDPTYYDPEEIAAEVSYLESLSDEEDEDDAEGELINEDLDGFLQDLRAAQGYKTKTKGKVGRKALGEKPLPPELRHLMGQANELFAKKQLDASREILEKVLQVEPGSFAAWKTLGEIFAEKGDRRRCLQCWIMAGLSKPREIELWLQCAKMSAEIYGPGEQAVHCLSKALQYRKHNIEIMYERACMYRSMGWNGKAVDGFRAILKLRPHDFRFLKELSRVLVRQQKVGEAIQAYVEGINFYMINGNVGEGNFGWHDLNILIDLYMAAKEWRNGITALRTYARWLYSRNVETFWDTFRDDDREWDEDDESRKLKVPAYVPGTFHPTTYRLPPELRSKLGVCRLKLGNKEEALKHFNYLNEKNPVQYSDLFQQAGDTLFEHEHFTEAIAYYRRILDSSVYDRNVLLNLAKCYRELNDAASAEEAYWFIIRNEPAEVDARMQLAVVLEAGDRREEALDLVNEIIALKKPKPPGKTGRAIRTPARRRGPARGETFDEQELALEEEDGAVPDEEDNRGLLFAQTQKKPARARRAALTAEQKEAAERRRAELTRKRFDKLQALKIAMEAGQPDAVKEWLDTAADLVDSFRNTRAFYPNERKTLFMGFTSAAKRRAARQSQEAAVKQLQSRLEESLECQEEEIQQPSSLTHFHGLDFDTWCYIFCQYALSLAIHEDVKDAYDVLLAATDANVFYHSPKYRSHIAKIQLACAIRVGDTEQVSEFLRGWMIQHQFRTDVYRLFAATFLVIPDGREKIKDGANQKFFLRQIKACDKCVLKKDIPGASALTCKSEDGSLFLPTEHDPMLHALYGHILMSGRGYMSALSYYSRVYGMAPSNPMVAFYIALAYLNRSMQRQSSNRQWEVLQAVAFMFEYYDARKKMAEQELQRKDGQGKNGWLWEQEAEYNIGRAFHQLGLAHLAVGFYTRCLELSEKYNPQSIDGDGGNSVEEMETVEREEAGKRDLRWEAAYNLQMIYFVAGNARMADEITEKWLVL